MMALAVPLLSVPLLLQLLCAQCAAEFTGAPPAPPWSVDWVELFAKGVDDPEAGGFDGVAPEILAALYARTRRAELGVSSQAICRRL